MLSLEDAILGSFAGGIITGDQGVEQGGNLGDAFGDDRHVVLHWLERRPPEERGNRIGRFHLAVLSSDLVRGWFVPAPADRAGRRVMKLSTIVKSSC